VDDGLVLFGHSLGRDDGGSYCNGGDKNSLHCRVRPGCRSVRLNTCHTIASAAWHNLSPRKARSWPRC
jgi:hypothetical protein